MHLSDIASAGGLMPWGIMYPDEQDPHWFVYWIEYPDEGTVGPFDTREQAVAWMKDNPSEDDEPDQI